MEPRSLRFVGEACQGELVGGGEEVLVERVCTDSRRLERGDLFFALRGDRFDGHDYLRSVDESGAGAMVVERNRWPMDGLRAPVIVVENARQALGRLALRYRSGFNLPIIAVAGSNGKTTTKELLAGVLRQKRSTLWSEASYNNDIGLPLTLLNLRREHSVAVVELGTNHPGELEPLMRIAQPEFGVLTNIGREHLEFFGDLEGVSQEEGWLAELLPPHGKLFIDGDSDWTDGIERRSRALSVRVGLGPGNAWRAGEIQVDGTGVQFRVMAPECGFSGPYRVNLVGRHQVTNALLAIAVAEAMGLSPGEVREGLASCEAPRMRLQLWESNGVRVLDDAYNANEDSTRVALETLRDLPCGGNRVAVLGDMAELGEQSAAAHEAIGRHAVAMKVNRLVAVGKWAGTIANAARDAGLKDVTEYGDVESAIGGVGGWAEPGDLVLLKASRVTGLDRIGAALGRGGD